MSTAWKASSSLLSTLMSTPTDVTLPTVRASVDPAAVLAERKSKREHTFIFKNKNERKPCMQYTLQQCCASDTNLLRALSSTLSTYMYRGSSTVMTRSGMHVSPLQSLKVSTLTCPTPLLATTGKPLKSVGSGLPSLGGMSAVGIATSSSITNPLKRSMIFLYEAKIHKCYFY